MKKILFIILLIVGAISLCQADTLDSWGDPRAYKPAPVLFVHGFGSGRPASWNKVIEKMAPYFSQYYQYSLPAGHPRSYLETVDLTDPGTCPGGSTNGSVDMYPDGRLGLAGRLKFKINELLGSDEYGAHHDKLNIVAHSLGGIVVRQCFVDYPASGEHVEKVIFLGAPHLGSPIADWDDLVAAVPEGNTLNSTAANVVNSRHSSMLVTFINQLLCIDPHGEAIQDVNPSGRFISELNSHSQPEGVDYFGIIGVVHSPLNWYFFCDWDGGDWIVPRESQLAISQLAYKEWKEIPFNHIEETEAAAGIPKGTRNDILYYFDSVAPELKVAEPDPSAPEPVEIYTYYLRLKGEVRKEYLPADTKLIISGVKLDDGTELTATESLLEPSSLWKARDSSTPVAEFDQVISFASTGNGNYKVFLQLENAAGVRSEIKEVQVKVNCDSPAFVIIHCHNPEGKEIASIEGVPRYESYPDEPWVAYPAVRIDCDGRLYAPGAYDSSTHNLPFYVTAGTHTFYARFNGIQTVPQAVTFSPMETKTLTFNFPRQEFDYNAWIAGLSAQENITVNDNINLTSPPYYTWQYKNDFKLFPGMNGGGVSGGASLFPIGDYSRLSYSAYSEISLTGISYHDYVRAQVNSLTSTDGIIPLFGAVSRCNFGEVFNKNSTPATTDFRYWYSQSIRNGYYPSISIGTSGISLYPLFGFGPFDYPPVFEGGYACRKVPAQLNYSLCEIKGGNSVGIGNNEWHREYSSPQESQHDGTIAVKISSVPYDFTGSGI